MSVGCDQAPPPGQAFHEPLVPPPPTPLLDDLKPIAPPEFPALAVEPESEPESKPDAELRRYRGHTGAVKHLECWPNGEGAVSAGDDGRLCVWQLDANEPLHTLELPEGEKVGSLAVSVDSRTALYATGKRWLAVLDLESGKERRRIDCSSDVTAVAAAADLRVAASGHRDGKVRLWNLEDGSELAVVEPSEDFEVTALAFSPSCQELVVARVGRPCVVIAVRPKPHLVSSMIAVHDADRVTRIAISTNGQLVALVATNGDVIAGALPRAPDPWGGPSPTEAKVRQQTVSFRPGPGLTAGFLPGNVHLYCSRGLEMAYRHLSADQFAGRAPGNDEGVECAVLSPAGQRLLLGLPDGQIVSAPLPRPIHCGEEVRVINVRGVRELLGREDFNQLEEAAKNFRAAKGTAPWGDPHLNFFYAILSAPRKTTNEKPDFEDHRQLLERWQAAKPDSATPRIALAGLYIIHAWDARGSGFAYSVTEEGWRAFNGRIEKAEQLLAEAIQLEPNDSEAYHKLVTIGKAQGWPRAKVDALVEKSLAIDPAYFATYREMADYLRPQWQGEPGDIAKFAATIANRLQGPRGDEAYGVVALVAANCEPLPDMYSGDFSSERLLAAARLFVEKYPDNIDQLAFASRVACLAKDRKLADQAFRLLKSTTGKTTPAWPDTRLLAVYRRWATGESAEASHPLPGLERVVEAHIEPVRAVAFSPDGQTLATVAGDPNEQVKLWKIADGSLVRTLRHDSSTLAAAFSPDGKRLATTGGGASGPEVRVWSLASQKRPTKILGHGAAVLATGFSHDGNWFATGGADGLVILMQKGKKDAKQGMNHAAVVRTLAFSPQANLLATGAEDGEVRILDVDALDVKQTFPVGGGINSVGLTGDGKYLVATADNYRVAICDLEQGAAQLHEGLPVGPRVPAAMREQFRGNYGPLACSATGSRFALAHSNHELISHHGAVFVVELWDAAEGGKKLGAFYAGGRVQALALSPDGKLLATGNE